MSTFIDICFYVHYTVPQDTTYTVDFRSYQLRQVDCYGVRKCSVTERQFWTPLLLITNHTVPRVTQERVWRQWTLYSVWVHQRNRRWMTLWRPLLPYGYTAIKHPVPDRVKPSFVIFDIRAFWASVRMPGCQKLQMTA